MRRDPLVPEVIPDDPTALAEHLLIGLTQRANPDNVAGMARYGISPEGTLGVQIPVLRGVVRELRAVRRSRPDYVHEVAAVLWASGVHEARMLAGFLDVPELATQAQADVWVAGFDSWDVCDQVTGLFASTPFAPALVARWTASSEVFTKRAGFVLICALAVHDKESPDEAMIAYLPLIEAAAVDDRTYVKKAVNWALRQIGKRSLTCHAAAVEAAERILRDHPDSRCARWIARDALRELRSDAVRQRLARSRA